MTMRKILVLFSALLLLLAASAVFGKGSSESGAEEDRPAKKSLFTDSSEKGDPSDTEKEEDPWKYLSLFEGLHITGEPIDVDIQSYELRVTGAVDSDLSFSFDEIKEMEALTKEVSLDCPGFFTDEGSWTGVPLLQLLEKAGLQKDVSRVVLTAVDGSYSATIFLDDITAENTLISYQFNDKEFHPYHGFPLRIVADGQPGNKWVKWLGEITVE
jgi:DMSO/TMAO reductase YedYZ molybdopterin-dependent catalytic subunit